MLKESPGRFVIIAFVLMIAIAAGTVAFYPHEVEITFDLEGYTEMSFNATQISIINVPQGYRVTSNASKVAVSIVGPEEVINNLSAKDIVVEIDMSTREITQTGQYRVYADVFLPGGENAWATGLYSITVTAKK